ncbi:DUF896 domain-containing protein [Williamsoniiplasma lucivorax]|uniref:Uncharacterized protein n=1 Tax=Williamsoniiplasma lucivorax TaxID=209274 RepID=A0A2S5RCY8_9MOLU|nr:DUF896 domain-containing protein [Williamsoniiplasma lucivorax]PPE05168.1 hypothetical protein ELUCI_v1c07040 [Williamsoniiplasma lucivorax]
MSMDQNKKIDAMKMNELIQEINAMVAIAKTRKLTPEEIDYRQLLREKYISIFREGVKQQLENITIIDEPTPKKKKKEKQDEK